MPNFTFNGFDFWSFDVKLTESTGVTEYNVLPNSTKIKPAISAVSCRQNIAEKQRRRLLPATACLHNRVTVSSYKLIIIIVHADRS